MENRLEIVSEPQPGACWLKEQARKPNIELHKLKITIKGTVVAFTSSNGIK